MEDTKIIKKWKLPGVGKLPDDSELAKSLTEDLQEQKLRWQQLFDAISWVRASMETKFANLREELEQNYEEMLRAEVGSVVSSGLEENISPASCAFEFQVFTVDGSEWRRFERQKGAAWKRTR